MNINKQIVAIDSHTMGEPTRIITSGVPKIPGDTMAEKKSYLEENMDHVRTMAMHEPRGHADMFGSIITTPVSKEADLGIIFMDGGGYLNMCGHGTIGAMTAAVEMGMLEEISEPYTSVTLEAPAGLVRGNVKVTNGKAEEVSFLNVPAFLYKQDVTINVPDIGKITADISFGGSFFAIVDGSQLDIDICPKNANRLCEIGMKIKDAANHQLSVVHPELPHINSIDLVEIYGPAKSEGATLQNIVVFGDGQVDRSPCGTGTSAKMATLYTKGKLALNEEFIYESVIGTTFKGRVVEAYEKDGQTYVIPEITASAYITGINHLMADPADSLRHGFTFN
ncbi:proline racemase family protein [Sansalvadorimonas sp. 2012CJ34-2]|uniref:Proline racemase family protein n=1 Tax=Parendozoicomonas callyspongiae TaxID=2942213 RepID=A0ABT0PD13_9GAMM|nr:proline racemase family protein [Sansalvadorimonas sp. 2012CJ34-2]MCL6269249.1 proline racemase family protein [Sansalvadorimonas sp. 2012CJ34-2]